MPEILLATFMLALAGLAFARLPPLHPLQLWALPWAVATSLLALHLLPYRPLSWGAAVLMAGASAAFAAGGLLAESAGRALERKRGKSGLLPDVAPRAVNLAAALAFLLLAAWLAFYLLEVVRRFGVRDAFVSSANVRGYIGAGGLAVGIKYVWAAIAAASLAGLAAGRSNDPSARRGWLAAAVIATSSAYFSTGRSTVVIAALAALIAYGVGKPGGIARRQLAFGLGGAAVFTLMVFLAGGALIGKTLDNNVLGEVRSPFTEHHLLAPLGLPYQYASAPIAAFDRQLELADPKGRAGGCATFTHLCSLLATAGLNVQAEPMIGAFTADPLPWNTYTALDRPLIDGGPGFVLLFFLVAGMVCGRLWSLTRRGRCSSALAYAILATALCYSSTQNNFFAAHIVGGLAIALGLTLAAGRWETTLTALRPRWPTQALRGQPPPSGGR